MNASVGFDVQTLSPTYRVVMGLPGGSSAIEIAGRLGMDESILDDALQRVQREDRALEQMLADLQSKQRRLDEDAARTAALRGETERAAREAAEVAERLTTTEREERARVKKKWSDELWRARAQVQSLLETLKTDQTVSKMSAAKQRLGELDEKVRQQFAQPEERIPLEQLHIGDRVEVAVLVPSARYWKYRRVRSASAYESGRRTCRWPRLFSRHPVMANRRKVLRLRRPRR